MHEWVNVMQYFLYGSFSGHWLEKLYRNAVHLTCGTSDFEDRVKDLMRMGPLNTHRNTRGAHNRTKGLSVGLGKSESL